MTSPRAAFATALVAAMLAGCGAHPSQIVVGPDGMRTFTIFRPANGGQLLCTAGASTEPLTGTLDGRAGEREPLWLVGPDGARLSIIWPEGFHARFDPTPGLFDDRDILVARAGDVVKLGQVARSSHRGTFDDPYIAAGIVFDGCYPYSG